MEAKEIQILNALKNGHHLNKLEREQAKEILRLLAIELESRK